MDGQYKLEEFGEIVAWTDDGKPFMAYRGNKNLIDTPHKESFEDKVRQLTKKFSNNMELGEKVRELCGVKSV